MEGIKKMETRYYIKGWHWGFLCHFEIKENMEEALEYGKRISMRYENVKVIRKTTGKEPVIIYKR